MNLPECNQQVRACCRSSNKILFAFADISLQLRRRNHVSLRNEEGASLGTAHELELAGGRWRQIDRVFVELGAGATDLECAVVERFLPGAGRVSAAVLVLAPQWRCSNEKQVSEREPSARLAVTGPFAVYPDPFLARLTSAASSPHQAGGEPGRGNQKLWRSNSNFWALR